MENTICLRCLKPLEAESAYSEYQVHASCYQRWFHIETLVPFEGIQRHTPSADFVSGGGGSWASSFFQGRFKKYSASLGNESYIIKVREEFAPELPDNEFLCNQIAESLGIPIPPYYRVVFGGSRAFVSKNFIQVGKALSLVHIYHYFERSVEYNCESILNLISEKTGRIEDCETFLRTCLFDALVGNHDRHARNLGFIVSARGMKLAPIYDNTSALGLESGEMLKADWNPRGKVGAKHTGEPTMRDYCVDLKRMGYTDLIRNFRNDIDLDEIETFIDLSFCTQLQKDAMKRLIHKRHKELCDELGS